MENPRAEIEDVVRSITEPTDVRTVLRNVDKYFTDDAFVLHPMANQPQCARGKQNLKAIYYLFCQSSRDRKITFHATMFSEDLTHCTLELTEDVRAPLSLPCMAPSRIRFLVRVDLRKEADGKYRIWRQHDNFVCDLRMAGLPVFPGAALLSDICKASGALLWIVVGRYFVSRLEDEEVKSD